MRKRLLLLLGLFLIVGMTHAQKRGCASHEIHEEHLRTDVKYAEKQVQIEEFTRQYVENFNPEFAMTSTITIPVVFHIVHDGDAVGSGENISDELVLAQLTQLNEDFRKTNSDAGNVPSEFAGLAADMQIEFCLASVDPNGNATTGINRVNGGQSSWSRNQIESNLKPSTIWDRDSYLNFWSVRFGGGDSSLLGYAQFPGGAANTDGVVCVYSSIGSVATPNPDGGVYARGRTGTHEVGHWINLRHIWGDDGGSCTGSDLVDDTPNQGNSYGGSPSYPQNSCGSSDMFMNYMDYVYDVSMYMFSEGQKARAQAALTGTRASLLNSNGCGQGTTPTCDDGVQNGDEEGIDCGGSNCEPCVTLPTCDDGIQNGDEEGVDCGGSNCEPCAAACTDNEVTLTITLDNYPEETSWTLTNDSGQTVASGGTYASQPDGSTISETFCLIDDCYTFTINDSYGDGICCAYGSGSYTLTGPSGTLASGGSFSSSESTDFCFGTTAPTCSDGIQNGDETGVDCGGSCEPCVTPPTCDDGIQNGDEEGVDCGGSNCEPCVTPPTCDDGIQNGDEEGVDCGGSNCEPCVTPPTCDDGIQNGDEEGVDCGGSNCEPCSTGGSTLLHEGYFESGWDGWVDGGSDCYRYFGSRSYEGNRSIRIRDNSGTASSMTLNNLNTTGYDQVEVKFYFYPNGMETGEDFWLRFNDGSGWQTVASWASGTSFENNSFYTATVVLDAANYSFNSGTDFRFQCDASANSDRIYIDQVTITGINGAASRTNSIEKISTGLADRTIIEDSKEEAKPMVYPNPARDVITVSSATMRIGAAGTEYQIFSSMGELMKAGEMTSNQLNIAQLSKGLYVIVLTTDGKKETIKFVKQ